MAIITSVANPSVKAARKLASRRHRMRTGAFLVEGPTVLAEAGDHLERVFVAEGADERARQAALEARAAGVELVEVSDEVLAGLADTATPRGVVGVARLEQPALDEVAQARLLVLCCDVGDPGNVGAIVRTADAAGADAVLLAADSVDATSPKAVRASAGSLFHLPVLGGVRPVETVAAARERGLRAVAADAGGAVRHTDEDLSGPTLLVLGGETHGLPTAVAAACDTIVRVAMFEGSRPGYGGRPESLNLAATAAVLAFEAVRQRADAAAAAAPRARRVPAAGPAAGARS